MHQKNHSRLRLIDSLYASGGHLQPLTLSAIDRLGVREGTMEQTLFLNLQQLSKLNIYMVATKGPDLN